VVENTDGVSEAGLAVYAFDGATYTGYNGTTKGAKDTTAEYTFAMSFVIKLHFV
jgi:hypothetical protein